MATRCDDWTVNDDLRAGFRELHRPGQPLVMPNAWDAGSAKLLESLGFAAIATTSTGFAATLGQPDGGVTRDEAIAHTAALAAATSLPVNADLEDCFADDPAGVAATIAAAAGTGAAGRVGRGLRARPSEADPRLGLARDRVAAAVEAAAGLVVTARAENHIRGVDDLADTIRRLQAYQEAGADVLYAPGLFRIEDVRAVVTSVDRPVNVLLMPRRARRRRARRGRRRPHLGRRLAGVGRLGRRRRRRPRPARVRHTARPRHRAVRRPRR